MPKLNSWFDFIYVHLGFIAQVSVMMYFKSIIDIKENWALYRCNPPYWIFSDNISADFTYCVQNTQKGMMNYLLQPINYMITSLTSVGFGLNESINDIRVMFSSIRGFVSEIVENVFGVFLNLIIAFQKIIISIKDMVGKLVGIVVTIMYVLEGSIKTMNSTWDGPPGQLVKALGSCFSPDTQITLKNGKKYTMENAPLGGVMEDGGKIFAVLKIDNPNRESLFKIKGKTQEILVTGEHFIFDEEINTWLQVKNYSKALEQKDNIPEYLSCLITTNRRIKIDDKLFWDWEDDELTKLL